MIRVENNVYELIEDSKDGFNLEAFKERYSDILSKFDYIAGDWGYGQLRLKGFFADTNRKASFDSRISFFDEYILEYCNFGCAYFLVKKVKEEGKTPADEPGELVQEVAAEAVQEKPDDKYAKGSREGKRREPRRRPRPKRKPKEYRETKEQPSE
ncbi:YutD family protein [Aneurinibacillus tyrosinisolvens]|uniref:YutD family protein n=1 Tax=Aneurinibacillus tyrosinisolvens TaxID=1443435 RepID=UPI00063FB683|nr:YutD family protein [Aneurinibacillus tyrosinisolvens]